MSLDPLVTNLRSHLPYTCGGISLFGAAAFRPGDEYYGLVGASATGTTLRLELEAMDGSRSVLSVTDPVGWKVRTEALGALLRIERASRVQWPLPWGIWRATVEGGKVRLRAPSFGPDQPDQERDLGAAALVIE